MYSANFSPSKHRSTPWPEMACSVLYCSVLYQLWPQQTPVHTLIRDGMQTVYCTVVYCIGTCVPDDHPCQINCFTLKSARSNAQPAEQKKWFKDSLKNIPEKPQQRDHLPGSGAARSQPELMQHRSEESLRWRENMPPKKEGRPAPLLLPPTATTTPSHVVEPRMTN